MFGCTGRDVDTGAKSEPGPAGSPETALKRFLSFSENAPDREARSAFNFVWHRQGMAAQELQRFSMPHLQIHKLGRKHHIVVQICHDQKRSDDDKATKSLGSTLR
jgi:hypothetical protein